MSSRSYGRDRSWPGRALLERTWVLLETASRCERRHPDMSGPVKELRAAVRRLTRRREEASLALQGGHLFCGPVRLRPDASGLRAFLSVRRLMKALDVGTIVFSGGATADDIDEAAHLLAEAEGQAPEERRALLPRLRSIPGIGAEGPQEGVWHSPGEERNLKESAMAAYALALGAAEEVMEDVREGRRPGFRRSRRAVQRLVDALLAGEEFLLGLAAVPCRQGCTGRHAVNVTVLSLAVGLRLGMRKGSLTELGLAALFHDLGKASLPRDILGKTAALTDRERAVMKRHPILGVRDLLRLKGVDALSARIMRASFEHHLGFDLSGYPEVGYGGELSLFGRIVGIADEYEDLTSPAGTRRGAEPPDRALRLMLARSGERFDPILLKLFACSVGLVPVGTLCLLDSGEAAVVVEGNPDPEGWARPVIRVVSDAAGALREEGEIVDLAGDGKGRSIARTLDAGRHGFDTARFLL